MPEAAEAVALAVLVAVVVVMAVAVIMPMIVAMRVAVPGIGAAQRLERLGDLPHGRAEAFQHRADDVVAQDQDAVGLDLRGEMAVADVPGELGEVHRPAGADVVDLLLGRYDLGAAAVVEHQHVAMVERDGLGQVDQHLVAMHQRQDAAAQVALVMGEHGEVEGLRPVGGRLQLGGAQDAPGPRQLGEIGVEIELHAAAASFSRSRARASAGRASTRSK
jgi:hypothetical protein